MKTKSKLRAKIIGSLSKAQLESPNAEGEAVIEQEADAILQAFSEELDELEGKAIILEDLPSPVKYVSVDAIKEMKGRIKK